MIEKADDVGGTWRDNTYPGACCDIPSQLYSFSFARNPDWSSSYSPQPEIQDYLRRVAARVRRARRASCSTPSSSTPRGTTRTQRWHSVRRPARSPRGPWSPAPAACSEPRLPEIEGIDSFAGRALPLRPLGPLGRPGRQAGRGDRHRRVGDPDRPRGAAGGGPPRRLPAHRPVGDPAQRPHATRRPSAPRCAASRRSRRLYRTGIYWAHEGYVPAFTWQPRLGAPAEKAALVNIHQGIKDPELRAKVTPTFRIGCKRVLRSNTYYPALAADNVDLVTDPIARVTPTGDRHRRRGRAPGRRDRRRDRLLDHRAADRRAHRRPRRPHAWPTSGPTAGCRRTRAPPSTASPTSSC